MIVTCKLIIETQWGILLVKDTVDNNNYSLPGGNFETKDKKYYKAAVRELKQELGLIVKRGKIKCLFEKVKGTPVKGQQREINIYIAKVRNRRLHPSLQKSHFDHEVGGIGFLCGKKRISSDKLQGQVKYVLKNYCKTSMRAKYQNKYMSDIKIDPSLLKGWI